MPKIKEIQGHNDSSFQMENIPIRNFTNPNSQNLSKSGRKSIHESIVPIYEVNYNPEFSKSPLATVEMSKKEQIRPIQPYHQETVYYDYVQKNEQFLQEENKTNWKTILIWILVVTLIIGLLIGLYFLLDAILSNKFNQNSKDSSARSQIQFSSSDGIAPIYFDPIAIDQIPKQSVSMQIPKKSYQRVQVNAATSPTPLETRQYSTSPSSSISPLIVKSPSDKKSDNDKKTQSSSQNSQQYSLDPQENSIAPLNVYESKPV